VHSLQPFYKDNFILTDLLTLETDGDGYSDETFIQLDSAATSHFDSQNDAYKLFGISSAPQIYSLISDTSASINVLPYAGQNTIVPLGFKVGSTGNYSIISHGMSSFTYVSSIYLKDAKLNYWQDLMTDSIYNFTSNPSDDPDRFFIYFNYVPAGIGTVEKDGIMIYSYEDFVYIRNLGNQNVMGHVCVYDLLGRQVFNDQLMDMQVNKFHPGVETGYYLARVFTEKKVYLCKIFLK
jgi:hypothetical protein